MNKKINLIQKFLIKNNFSFYLVTNSDIHLNESPNLKQKDIFNLTGFDCSNGYLIIFKKNIVFFTDSRYTFAASNFFKKKCEVFDLKNQSITDYLQTSFSNIKGLIDPKLISIREIINLKNRLDKSSIKIIPYYKHVFSKNYFPNFNISYPFSLPKYCLPRKYTDNIRWIKSSLKSQGIIIWNNSHVAYLLNIRSFEIQNSTKPFAGLYIPKKNIKPILISDNKYLKQIDKLNKNFDLMSQKKFISYIFKSKINSIETNYKYSNFDIYLSLTKNIFIKETKIDVDKKISQKTKVEINNIKLCHIQDGISLTKFILQSRNNNESINDEYSIANNLYQFRKQGVNFFRNSFDYISAFDKNAAIIHYKPSRVNSQKLSNQSLLLLDSGAHYLEGTTDVTRVIKLNKLKFKNIKTYYTHLLKSLILVENSIFPKGITGSDLDSFIRSYLSKYNIFYGHGTGHGVGYFNDVHEKYPILSPNSKQIILNNNLFSIEPGFYLNNQFGLRLENLYFSKISNKKIKIINTTLVPYDLSLIDWKLITKKERNFIKNYHKKILKSVEMYLSVIDRKKYIKNLINKI